VGVVVAGTVEDLQSAFRGLAADVRRGRTGLLLGPVAPLDGDLLAIGPVRAAGGPPGRGVLAVGGTATAVQVAC
jgi:S-DNA-T family DNA segregation ATPase FtsK/SpoIIIE